MGGLAGCCWEQWCAWRTDGRAGWVLLGVAAGLED
jgi:hypothetical protein